LLSFGISSSSVNIGCGFGFGGAYTAVGNVYRCITSGSLSITTKESAQVSGVSGTHESFKSNKNVEGFRIDGGTIYYFPKGLEKFFGNLKMIYINPCQLKEIHQSDLVVFPHLVFLYLQSNNIEVIEENLFKFNPNLEALEIRESKITHIDPNVFDNLNKLSIFRFTGVPCINQNVDNSREKVLEAIKIVKSNCTNPKFSPVFKQIEYLETGSEFFTNLSKNPTLQTKFEDIKLTAACSNCAQLLKISALETKVDNLGENLNFLITDSLRNITTTIGDPTFAQCGMNNATLSSIMSSVSANESKLKSIEENITELKKNQNDLKASLDKIAETLKTILRVC